MPDVEHRTLGTGSNHIIENWVFADATARAAATPSAADVGKVAYQTDNGMYYRLLNHSPLTWSSAIGGGGNTTAEYVTTAADGGLSAEVAIPGLAGSPDRAGIGGGTFSEEYDTNSAVLTASSAPTTINYDTTFPSHVYIAQQSDNTARTYLRSFVPGGSTAFDVRTVISMGNDGNAPSGGLLVTDSSSVNIVMIQIFPSGGNAGNVYALQSYSGSGFSAIGTERAFFPNSIYLRITRDASNIYKTHWSADGKTWNRHATTTIATAVDKAGYRFHSGSGNDVILVSDWLRAG